MNKTLRLRFITYSLFLLPFSFHLHAQDLNYAHRLIDTLTSPAMHGRGYVKNGCNIAAEYIKHQFDSLHLQYFNNNYFQDFSFPVNTFPSKMELNVNGKTLVPGRDFIVEGASGKGSGDYPGVIVSNKYTHTKEEVFNFLRE